jgi:hypothetical protein
VANPNRQLVKSHEPRDRPMQIRVVLIPIYCLVSLSNTEYAGIIGRYFTFICPWYFRRLGCYRPWRRIEERVASSIVHNNRYQKSKHRDTQTLLINLCMKNRLNTSTLEFRRRTSNFPVLGVRTQRVMEKLP